MRLGLALFLLVVAGGDFAAGDPTSRLVYPACGTAGLLLITVAIDRWRPVRPMPQAPQES